MPDEYNSGDDCPACERHDSSYFDEGTLQEMHTGDLTCDECGSIFSPRGTCKMNNLSKSVPPWIDRDGEVDPVKKQQSRIDDIGAGRSYPDHYYGDSNRRL